MPSSTLHGRSRSAGSPARHPLWRWWRRLSPSRQDRFATFGPLLSVLLFLAAMLSAFWYLRAEEQQRLQDVLQRDAEQARLQMRQVLVDDQEHLSRLARDLALHNLGEDELVRQLESFLGERRELLRVMRFGRNEQMLLHRAQPGWPDENTPVAVAPASSATPQADRTAERARLLQRARRQHEPVYGVPLLDESGTTIVQFAIPVLQRDDYAGALVAEYSLERLVRDHVAPEIRQRHTVLILDGAGNVLASSGEGGREPVSAGGSRMRSDTVPFAPLPTAIGVRSVGYHSPVSFVGNTLFWMVLGLSALTLWMLLGTWRHLRQRLRVQDALVSEMNFRRAMENSMLTGMRAMDLEGRITYVNPAFCAMTGFAEHELIGVRPPYPHWPPDRQEESMRLLQQELQGRTPPGGIEVRVMRKDESRFDARMYVSPLIDARGVQTGWMTSMTNITEAKRIRDQLSASHERFTTVLEGLEAAVSVVSDQDGELLFANRSYRLWFGADALGHRQLAGGTLKFDPHAAPDDAVDAFGGLPTHEITDAASEVREIFIDSLQKWFDVRARYLQWTDGRLAQMLIATDVTARRHAEEMTASQVEKAHVTSRLMTMGEMASAVAHELNQPLTAITNYCNGMIGRVRKGSMSEEDLVAALEKTARQAQRAGQVIHRIRNFVKRSEPQAQQASARQIVDDALELAHIALQRRKVSLRTYVAEHLPPLRVDPILIEQVIINIVKNAAEAIDEAKLPATRRQIELRVVPRLSQDEGEVIEFCVTDTGPGLPEDVLRRLYEAFFSTKSDGMGMGLSLCRSIIEAHRGRIRAENLYNGDQVSGCRFTFTLPVDAAGLKPMKPAVEPTDHS